MWPGRRAAAALAGRAAAFGPARSLSTAAAPNGAAADASFALPAAFVSAYRTRKPPFGFNGLGEFVYRRTYARTKADGATEQWHETVERVVNGTFRMQQRWAVSTGQPWDARAAEGTARRMYDKIFAMKFLPPGRGLWAMGSPLTEERHLYAALNNCAFVSTKDMLSGRSGTAPSQPFTFLMDASMLGVGVGFDTEAAYDGGVPSPTAIVRGVDSSCAPVVYTIPDSREGWVESVRRLLDSYFYGTAAVHFDYSAIRPSGEPIRGFGGTASGPDPLRELHEQLRRTLELNRGRRPTVTTIVDMMNFIGKCVVSGNVRQTAEIAFGRVDSDEYIDLKNYTLHPHRASYGWTSNNSVYCTPGQVDYARICDRVRMNGEPGFFFLENARRFSRMNGVADGKDWRAVGGNPCLEQTLESYELCCLVETFPNNHATLDEFLDTLELAFEYAKTVTLGLPHWPETSAVVARNRRIGTSMSGLAQFISQRGLENLRDWCERGFTSLEGVDARLSARFGIPLSIKRTSIKPSGTVSLLAGATPGMHYPESRFCIRRVRLGRATALAKELAASGYPLEEVVGDRRSVVVEFPVDMGAGIRALDAVSMWEQLALAAFLQRHWSDNQVSCTITFDPATEGPQLAHALDYYQYQLKGVSFLPRLPEGAYPQMPIEAISEVEYQRRLTALQQLPQRAPVDEHVDDKYCDNDSCAR